MTVELVKRLVEICGSDHVLHSPEAIELYSRCTIPWSRTCGAVVLPENYDQLCELLKTHHYQQYRCTTPQMETILECNSSYQHLMKQIKQALDPNQVIAPGRYGV